MGEEYILGQCRACIKEDRMSPNCEIFGLYIYWGIKAPCEGPDLSPQARSPHTGQGLFMRRTAPRGEDGLTNASGKGAYLPWQSDNYDE